MTPVEEINIGDLIRIRLQIYQILIKNSDMGKTEYFCGIVLKKELRGKNTYITFFHKDPYGLYERNFCFDADNVWYDIKKVG